MNAFSHGNEPVNGTGTNRPLSEDEFPPLNGNRLAPNRADITRHLYALFQPAFAQDYPDAQIEIAWSHPENGELDKAEPFPVFALEQAAEFAERQNLAGLNVYVGAALRKAGTTGRANGASVITASHAWDDFDECGDLDRVDTVLKEKNLQTSMTVITGTVPHTRFQPYFQFAEAPTCEQLRAANLGLRNLLGGDAVQNPDRVLRLAGTINYPTSSKIARGYIPELTTLHLRKNTPAYRVTHLIDLGGKAERPEPAPFAPALTEPSDARKRAYGQAALEEIAGELAAIPKGARRNNGAYLAGLKVGSLIAGGCLSEGEGYSRLVQACQQGWNEPTDRAYGPRGAIMNGIRNGMKNPRGPRDYADFDFSALLAERIDHDPETGEVFEEDSSAEAGNTRTAGSTAANDGIWDPWHEAPVPRLDMSLLPEVVRKAAEISAQVSGADVDAFAIGYLVGLTACGDTRLQITPKQFATDWSVPLLLWIILIAPPSSMKSEIIKKARSLAASLDAQERKRYDGAVAMAEIEVSLRIKQEKMTKAQEKQARIEAIQQVPPPRQRVCQDITIEKYVEILSVNPGGTASFREELAGWLGALGRYTANGSDGNDRSFYCHLHDGAPFDRQIKSAKDIHLEYCAGSFLGAVQVDRLREFKLPMTDGLFQRFMPMMMRKARGYEDSPEADDAKKLLRPVRDRLVALVPEMETDAYGQMIAKPFKLSPEGAALYAKFANDMRIAAEAGEPTTEFGECLQKMGPMWLSFALLFHLVEATPKPWGTAMTPAPTFLPARIVPTTIAKRADALLRGYFIPHAEHFYDLISGGSAARRTRSLAVAILRCEKDDIVLRDVGRLCRAIRDEKRDVQIGMMQRFETFGWLIRLDKTGTAHPRWQRTAGLKTRFEEDLKREAAARKAMSEAIRVDATVNKEAREANEN